MLNQMILVFFGGAIGAAAREVTVVAGMNLHNHFPTAILGVNLTAAFLIGLVSALTEKNRPIDRSMQLFVNTGIMGGLSTFSTLIWGTLVLLVLEQRQIWIGITYLGISLIAGVALVELGLRFGASLKESKLK
ncbi:fluoride efflux transporter FluC [Nitrospira sp. T9]|uniref:fluoride efflux transporter FluC n=2 Tax=unclassified Nitrospira TaxID=2652172 RepID=UPI003F9960BF